MEYKAEWDGAKRNWDRFYAGRTGGRKQIKYDGWLEPFQDYIAGCETPVIDLGCGSGNNTLYLVERDKTVIPCDYSQAAVDGIRRNFPEVPRVECFDMAEGFPFEDGFTNLVVADLCLHYFPERVTFDILNEIRRVLRPGGMLLFRVNSVRDKHYGAGRGEEVERHYYRRKDGGCKRFFDRQDIQRFFQGWDVLSLREERMNRYLIPKELWVGAARCGEEA